MSRTPLPTFLLGLDLECTDSDPYLPHAAILEVGAVLVRWEPELPEVARASLVVRPAGTLGEHDVTWAQMPEVVRRMHDDNGLWLEATTSPDAWSQGDADDAISGWLRQHAGDQRVPLLGSGVGHLDLPFVKRFMPRLATMLTYWPIDIGNVRRMLELAGRGDLVDLATDVDGKPHRALGDAELHVAEARRYLQLLAQLPQLEPVSVSGQPAG